MEQIIDTVFNFFFIALLGVILNKMKKEFSENQSKTKAIEKSLATLIKLEIRKSHKHYIKTVGHIDTTDYGQLHELFVYFKTLDDKEAHVGELTKLMDELTRLNSFGTTNSK